MPQKLNILDKFDKNLPILLKTKSNCAKMIDGEKRGFLT